MEANASGWQERLRLEDDAAYRMDAMLRRGALTRKGAGQLGQATLGGGTLTTTFQGQALAKTLSKPIVAEEPPTGNRIGADLGMSECGSRPGTPLAHRLPAYDGDTESRLRYLETAFKRHKTQSSGLQKLAMSQGMFLKQATMSLSASAPFFSPAGVADQFVSRSSAPSSRRGTAGSDLCPTPLSAYSQSRTSSARRQLSAALL
eukprot:TRINITY_DN124071_c0_g1_i1.p1 TRINITY_DN124071_c0_g1~~TRINITY_DN124071_c0_g1_i1.p1  ORF type:complete len:204 (+),score=21.02 TRINITY_DN124071_c0_g1_i1:80-691(+)